ncbi:MAG: helix-turn-helix transcriptional regulator [Propionibacteriaceae bacterium]|nr:helix-turn-helix transcriptional regulator [Propionibacteriaceae bacterium]
MSDKSHYFTRRASAADGPAGLFPPPPLNWTAWREHVQALKRDKGLSIADLTGRSGLDRSTVIELLGGRRGVGDARVGTLWALAWALEVEDFSNFIAPLTGATQDDGEPG